MMDGTDLNRKYFVGSKFGTGFKMDLYKQLLSS